MSKIPPKQIGEDRIRIVKALNYLEEHGFISLQVSGVRQIYRFVNRSADPDGLITRLQQQFIRREERDIAMSDNVIKLLEHKGCKTRYLLNFFGEKPNADCGHCEWLPDKS